MLIHDSNRQLLFFLLIPSLGLLALFFAAIATLLGYSFYEYVQPGVMNPAFTLDNYITFLTEPTYLHVLYRTMRLALISTVFALVMGYPIAYEIARSTSAVIRKICILVSFISLLSSVLVRLFAWRIILSRTGPLNQILRLLGFSGLHSFLRTETAVTIGLISFLVPFVILNLAGVINKIDPNLEEAAESLGANKIVTFFKITLPLSMPGVLAASLLCYCLGMSAYIIPLLLGGDAVKLMSNIIYDQLSFVANFPMASVAAVILLIVSLIVIVSYQRLMRRYS